MHNANPTRLLEKLFFTSIRSYHYRCEAKPILIQRTLHTYALCSITSGKGILVINGAIFPAAKGDLFILQPDMIIEGKSNNDSPVQYSLILFTGVQLIKNDAGWMTKRPDFILKGKLGVSGQSPQIKGLIEQLLNRKASSLLPDRHSKRMILSDLLHEVMNIENSQTDNYTPVGMERTIAYMNEHYIQDIKIEQLAQMAGFSMNHFTRTFKQQMNMTPTEYLVKQRMAKAKQLLFSSKKAKEVAEQVGYKDEHYFSRVFKKAEGVPPTLYIKNKCHRIAALYYGLDDHLLTLGLRPVAALSYAERVSSSYPEIELSEYTQEGLALDSRKSNYDILLRTKPDIMITSDRLIQDEALNQIAPTAVLTHSNHYGTMLEHMAKILGREKQAANWVDKYVERKESIKNNIRARWGQTTAYFIRVRPDYYRVYGKLNQTGSLLYDDLGFTLPREFPGLEWAVDIQLKDLVLFNADHIF